MNKISVLVEEGQKKTFVVAIDWPGWARWGKEESAAIESLIEFAPRYAQVVRAAGLEFSIPESINDFEISARLEGNATTSFGAPDIQMEEESAPLDSEEYQRQLAILHAAWDEFDQQVDAAWGKDLRKGPRGGGRSLEKIIIHTLQADEAYLKRLARKIKLDFVDPLSVQTEQVREAILEALEAGMRGEIPEKGPRGGKIWPLRFFLRRVIWHTLDHAWEIGNRVLD